MGNTRGGDARDYIGARLKRLASNPEKSGSIGSRPCPAWLRTEGDGSADMRPQDVSERRGGGGSAARAGLATGPRARWARRWLGRQADREGFPLSLFFPISFLFSFPKPFPNSILKAQTNKIKTGTITHTKKNTMLQHECKIQVFF